MFGLGGLMGCVWFFSDVGWCCCRLLLVLFWYVSVLCLVLCFVVFCVSVCC